MTASIFVGELDNLEHLWSQYFVTPYPLIQRTTSMVQLQKFTVTLCFSALQTKIELVLGSFLFQSCVLVIFCGLGSHQIHEAIKLLEQKQPTPLLFFFFSDFKL